MLQACHGLATLQLKPACKESTQPVHSLVHSEKFNECGLTEPQDLMKRLSEVRMGIPEDPFQPHTKAGLARCSDVEGESVKVSGLHYGIESIATPEIF